MTLCGNIKIIITLFQQVDTPWYLCQHVDIKYLQITLSRWSIHVIIQMHALTFITLKRDWNVKNIWNSYIISYMYLCNLCKTVFLLNSRESIFKILIHEHCLCYNYGLLCHCSGRDGWHIVFGPSLRHTSANPIYHSFSNCYFWNMPLVAFMFDRCISFSYQIMQMFPYFSAAH